MSRAGGNGGPWCVEGGTTVKGRGSRGSRVTRGVGRRGHDPRCWLAGAAGRGCRGRARWAALVEGVARSKREETGGRGGQALGGVGVASRGRQGLWALRVASAVGVAGSTPRAVGGAGSAPRDVAVASWGAKGWAAVGVAKQKAPRVVGVAGSAPRAVGIASRGRQGTGRRGCREQDAPRDGAPWAARQGSWASRIGGARSCGRCGEGA
ncbi:unnamed protein product [Closterium sp. NIES-54]